MKKLSLAVLFLFCSIAHATFTPDPFSIGFGGNPITAGVPAAGVPISDAENEITLTACKNASTNNHLFKLYKGSTGSQYQVTASFHFVAHDVEYLTNGTANADGFQFLTGTAALAQDDDTVAPTAVAWAMGASGKPQFVASQTGWNSFRAPVCFAQSLYPAIQAFNNTGTPNICVTVTGREYAGASCK
jgi:hypothetical protein